MRNAGFRPLPVILSGAKDLKIRNWRSFAVFAAQDDGDLTEES
jgi:hypothetical protein